MTMLSELPVNVRRKLWDIQRTIAAVQADLSDGDDAFRFAPAAGVFDEVKRQLRLKQVMVVPSVISSSRDGEIARARVALEVTDLEDPEDESVAVTWEGESSDGLAAACTAALKGWYVAVFLIRLDEPSHETRHAAREKRAKENPTVTANQRRHFIGSARKESGIGDDEYAQLLQRLFGTTDERQVPRHDAQMLVGELRAYGKRKALGRSEHPTAEMAAISAAAGEPADG